MSMAANVIWRKTLIALREMSHEFRITTCSTHTTFGIDDDVAGFNEAGLDQRSKRDDSCRGVAARVGDENRVGNLLSKQLRKSIDGSAKTIAVDVGLAVPLLVRWSVVQSIVCTEVDNLGSSVDECWNN
jgi:hypothetical protein